MEKIDDIKAYLKEHENKQLLRFITCGNVDDGKSTLIGRLLHDSKGIFEDQLENIKKDSKKNNSTDNEFDLSLLVDGLQSEREQGITIDVAYRYFTTPKKRSNELSFMLRFLILFKVILNGDIEPEIGFSIVIKDSPYDVLPVMPFKY